MYGGWFVTKKISAPEFNLWEPKVPLLETHFDWWVRIYSNLLLWVSLPNLVERSWKVLLVNVLILKSTDCLQHLLFIGTNLTLLVRNLLLGNKGSFTGKFTVKGAVKRIFFNYSFQLCKVSVGKRRSWENSLF